MALNPAFVSPEILAQYTDTPSLTPPPGVVPNFSAHNERAEVYKILCSMLLGIVYLFVCLRMYAKFWIKRNPGFDDLACVLATIGISACFGLAVAMSQHGIGKHQWDVPLSEIPFVVRVGKQTSILWAPTFLCLKMSLLLLYLRIFAPDKSTRYLIYFGMAFCFLAYTTIMFLNIFLGIAVLIGSNKALGAVNIFSDFYILCIPIPAVSKLQLSLKKALGVIFIFLTGIIACAMSIISLVFRIQVYRTEADATWLLSGTFIVTTIEAQIGLMCACMPFFPAIVKDTPALKKFAYSVQYLGSLTFRSSRHSSATDANGSYEKHGSRDGSVEDGLELQKKTSATGAASPESPKKTPRMELGAFEGGERLQSSRTEL